MSTLFSSPSKQAQSAASGANAISDAAVTKAENYVGGQEQQLRNALTGLGPNPFITAASQIAPKPIDQNNTTTFSAPPPPSQSGATPPPPPPPPAPGVGSPFAEPQRRMPAAMPVNASPFAANPMAPPRVP